jgi:hypothetical protein
MYIKLNNGNIEKYPYSYSELIGSKPDTSFPSQMPDERLADYEVYPVATTTFPQVDYTKNVVEDTPELVDDIWTQVWAVSDKPSDEVLELTKQLRAEAYRNESDPLFFKWQRGEATEQEWLDKVNEIKTTYPNP